MRVRKIIAENFRGARNATYEFSDKTLVKGMNGSGKSTIPSMIYWVFADRDVSLTANPQVRTIGAIDEQQTVVTIDCDFDGKPVQVQKSQRLKRSNAGTVSLTNSYMVNSVPKSEKDFRAYLAGLGVDFDKFLPCSHPNVTLAEINSKKGKTALRNMLFEMAGDITDWDVANGDPELKELAALLKDYDTEEIAAIQNNTLRKIRENYGREGEILMAKIEGMEKIRVDVDAKGIQEKIKKTDDEIADLDKRADALNKKMDEISGLRSKLIEKEFAISELKSKAGEERRRTVGKTEQEIFMMDVRIRDAESEIRALQHDINNYEESLKQYSENIKKNMAALKKIKALKFDASAAICPTCGQSLRGDSLKKAEKVFDDENSQRILRFENAISMQENKIGQLKEDIQKASSDIEDKRSDLDELKNRKNKLKDDLDIKAADPDVDISGSDEYKDLMAEMADIRREIDACGAEDIAVELQQIRDVKEVLFRNRHEYAVELGKEQSNKEIDRQIASLRESQRNYEQQKADAEMILDQLKTLNMKKNKLLQDSVNKNFNLISWKLFDFRKNGETFDTCIPMIDGKSFGESMNTALEIMAKIDAMNGIQRFFGFDYPIVLDDAEHLDSESMKNIETDHQLIMLCVSDDKELVFEGR